MRAAPLERNAVPPQSLPAVVLRNFPRDRFPLVRDKWLSANESVLSFSYDDSDEIMLMIFIVMAAFHFPGTNGSVRMNLYNKGRATDLFLAES